ERESEIDRRARFAAWSLTRAILLRTSPEHLAELQRVLRALADREDATVALVFFGDDGSNRSGEAELGTAAGRLARLLGRAGLADFPLVAAWAEPAAETPSLPIELGENDVLVVPRMGALARLQDFRAELSAALLPHQLAVKEWPE